MVDMYQDLSELGRNINWKRKNSQRLLKRAFDILFSLFLMCLLWPFMLVTAFLVRITSKGPIMIRQERIGLYGKPFAMYKYRSMKAENPDGTSKAVGDVTNNSPHLTPIGGFIRAWRFDELPQLWNIFKGDMSFVGPRADLFSNLKLYGKDHLISFTMPPGATAWTATRGAYNCDWVTRRNINVEYINKWNFWLDIKIIVGTIFFVLKQEDTVPFNTEDESRNAILKRLQEERLNEDSEKGK